MSCRNPFTEHKCTYKCVEDEINALKADNEKLLAHNEKLKAEHLKRDWDSFNLRKETYQTMNEIKFERNALRTALYKVQGILPSYGELHTDRCLRSMFDEITKDLELGVWYGAF